MLRAKSRGLDPLAKSPELRSWPVARILHKPLFAAFLLCWSFNFGALFFAQTRVVPTAQAIGGIALAATILIGLARRLPAQNVITAAIVLGLASLGLLSFGRRSGIPFGAFDFARTNNLRLLGVPWILPIYWMALAICARGASRLPLRPWRKTTHYGYWMIALSLLIVIVTLASAEPVLGKRAHYWIWRTRPGVWAWCEMPWSNWLGVTMSFFAMYVLATPWLINKQPVKQPVDWHPFLVLVLLEIYFTTANGLIGEVGALVLGSCCTIILALFALRGARW